MDEDNPTPAAPSAAPPEGAVAPSIPKPRFDEVNERMKVAENGLADANARTAELESELQRLRSPAPAAPAPTPTPPAAPASPEPRTQADTSDRDVQLERLTMIVEHGVSAAQADVLMGYRARGLSGEESLTLAQTQHPQLFGRDARGFDPNAHSTAPPGTRPPRPPADPTFSEQLAATRDPVKRQSMALKAAADLVSAQIHGQLDRR